MSIVDKFRDQFQEGKIAPPHDPELEKACPNLWELLTLTHWGEDGKVKRILPELVVNRVPGGFEVILKDHATCLQTSAFAPRLIDIAKALEAALLDSTKPLKPFQSFRNRSPKIPEEKSGQRKRR
jgi:hypothetical protein